MREYKGNSLLDLPESFTIIDLETTGLSPEWDDIIELSALKIKNGEIIDRYSSLVHTPDVSICEYITELTGITQEMVDNAPEIFDILPEYFSFLEKDILIGHNINFDINFLYDKCMIYFNKPVTNDFVDTMRLSRRLHPEEPHHRLQDMAERYSVNYDGAHRSEQDCTITFDVYKKLKKEVYEKFGSEESFLNSLKRKRSKRAGLKSSDIHSENTDFDTSHPIYGKVCVFTGTLEKMVRKDAMQLVADFGGINGDRVTKKTNYLILGNNDYCKTIKNGKSIKQKQAEKLKIEGKDIEIISENVFYDMVLEE